MKCFNELLHLPEEQLRDEVRQNCLRKKNNAKLLPFGAVTTYERQ